MSQSVGRAPGSPDTGGHCAADLPNSGTRFGSSRGYLGWSISPTLTLSPCPGMGIGGRGPVMTSGVPVILIASASSYGRHCVERALQKTGRRVCSVADTAEAERVCAEDGGASILVIDSGLLEAPHNAQWRKLRRRHPTLGAVVCC